MVAAIGAAGGRGVAVACDVREEGDVEDLFAAAAALGTVTGLVSSAGLTAHIGDLADTPVEVVRRVVDTRPARCCAPGPPRR